MKKVSLVTVLLSVGSLVAQNSEPMMRNPYYNASNERKEKIKAINVDNKDVFKFDPLHMVSGEINFAWEHKVGDHSSVEVELGPTISSINGVSFSHYATETNNQYTSPQFGLLFSGGYRFYPLEDFNALNKFYVSPKFRFRQYNFLYSDELGGLGEVKGYSNEAAFFFNIGFQKWLSNHFALDFYTGIGLGTMVGRTYYQQYTYDSNTGLSSMAWVKNSFNDASLMGTIGMKVSFGQ